MANFPFDKDKAIAAMLYVAQSLDSSDMHSVFKILYFADQSHLVKYGRPIVGDSYIAMENGPVPSKIYDWCKESRESNSSYEDKFQLKGKTKIDVLTNPDLEEFSESDLECLNEAVQIVSPLSFSKRKELSHDKAWEETSLNGRMSIVKIARAGGADDEWINYIKDQIESSDIFF